MNLAAFKFQFYSYNTKPTQKFAGHDDNFMDVDDIEVSSPPPKPPRTFATLNDSEACFNNTCNSQQLPCITSTPLRNFMPTTSAAEAQTHVVTETPKSIYSRGLLKKAKAATEADELQLQPKLHANQRRWSSELRKKVLEMSKCSSGFANEDDLKHNNEAVNQPLQLTPQHHIVCSSFAADIKQKALEISKRKSQLLKTATETTANKMPTSQINSKDNFDYKTPLINAAAYEKIIFPETSSKTDTQSTPSNTKSEAFSRIPQQQYPNNRNEPPQGCTQTVKERIRFFNKLTSSRSNSFINLLKNTKTTALATTKHSTSLQSSPPAKPPTPRKISMQFEVNLQRDDGNTCNNAQLSQTCLNVAKFSPQNICNKTAAPHTPSSATITAPPPSSTIQRKNSLRRKMSVDKIHHPIVRQNSNATANGTKPQMHTAMEDLSLVMPVKLRIAEYERRIKMKC